MKGFFAVAAAIAGAAFAADATTSNQWKCMSYSDAKQVQENFANLLTNYTETLARQSLSTDVVDYSESVNTLIDSCPQPGASVVSLTGPTFVGLEAFIAGQGGQPPINFELLNLWYSCDTVHFRWMTTNTAPIPNPRPVIGLITLETCPAAEGNEYPYIIKTIYSEFASAAWVENLQAAGLCPTYPGNFTFKKA